jgi:hypothetical protein
MDIPDGSAPSCRRRAWIVPELVRHESLCALTRQHHDPVTGRPLDPSNPEDAYIITQGISGGEDVFP